VKPGKKTLIALMGILRDASFSAISLISEINGSKLAPPHWLLYAGSAARCVARFRRSTLADEERGDRNRMIRRLYPMTAVEVKHLYKSYADVTAVHDLTFSVNPGEILGLIGPNGAGKSSTIRIILDFMKPDSGVVRIFGQQMNEALKDQIGYLPEERGLYKRLTAIELILYLASLKGMDKATAERKADDLLELTGMLENKNKKNKEMSKGMGQLIQFIVTVIHDPELIILDEPFAGLDPVRTETVQNIIGNLRDEGKAIILSTHQMNKVEELCDRVLMINKGHTVLYGDLTETRARFKRNSVQVDADGELGDLPGVIETKLNNGSVELVLSPETTPQTILDRLRERGITINRFEVTTPSLNEIFLNLAGVDHE
jgi:ABC-2 type transport system ATP-binding protein